MNANDVGLICDAVTKLGIAGKQAFALFMAVKALEVLVTGGVIVYALTAILNTVRRGIASSSFCRSLVRIASHRYCNSDLDDLSDDAKKQITQYVIENMTDKK